MADRMSAFTLLKGTCFCNRTAGVEYTGKISTPQRGSVDSMLIYMQPEDIAT